MPLTTHLVALALLAHPVEVQNYDRSITVRLTPSGVVADYVLEVNSLTTFNDVVNLVSKEERSRLSRAEEIHEAFARASAPILANNLVLRLDGKLLPFTVKSRKHQVLDHLRCEYRLEADWKLEPGSQHTLTVRETNYDGEPGGVRLALEIDRELKVLKSEQPDEALKKRPIIDLRPGDELRLRTASATFQTAPPERLPVAPTEVAIESQPTSSPPSTPEPTPTSKPPSRQLHDLLFDSDLGIFAMLGLAALLGAIHALTPGHGKTLVAAYLVGQRGTSWHAIFLGLVTALTHTGVVLLVALLLPYLFPNVKPSDMQQVLGFIGGLLVAALGFWMLHRRLAGKADHFHIGGGHHHHHHHHEPGEPLNIKGLIVLGISGGIVPCGEAIILLVLAVRWERLELAFPLLLAFSVGLAAVLVGIGLGVVWTQRFTAAHFKSKRLERLVRLLPILSAILITGIGLWLCYDSVHSATPH
jgi:ABC-type nickel/cobalt efflux system permease component RcnA